MKDGKGQVAFNLSLATLFSALVGLMLPIKLAVGNTLISKFADLPSVIADGLQAAPRAFVSSSLIPLAVSIVCGAVLLKIAIGKDSRLFFRTALIAMGVTGILVVVAALLQGGVPMLALVLVPLAFACVAARRIMPPSSPASG